ncbi:hypothetical protein [Hymenobacter actinosclerus]|uniref:Lipocalin-like domain-containing protein n=1 Tax=Hymenobacter actinosclerus TaxID=82805 RepID=A0A1I0AH04_9BACT|nr:hypothetical protein [Hymenobacter actinosclerus]SES93543.1 hypothetical protein SAMN04487998_0715 [Hymenobacter actinosclerus]
MRTLLLTLLAATALFLGSCASKATEAPIEKQVDSQSFSNAFFGKLWINSYEAQRNETPVYRPEGYVWATPPERYNMPMEGGDGFRLDADGTGVYIAPGIGPGPTTHPVTWKRESPEKPVFLIHVTDNSRPDMRLEVVSVVADRLTARYLP